MRQGRGSAGQVLVGSMSLTPRLQLNGGSDMHQVRSCAADCLTTHQRSQCMLWFVVAGCRLVVLG